MLLSYGQSVNGRTTNGAVFASIGAYNPYNHETEKETEDAADYGSGLYACEPQGGKAGRDCRAREAGFNEVGAPQIQKGL